MALVPGRDYPNTYRGFVEMFTDDNECAAFLARLRWPKGFICPACKTASTPWKESRGRLACPICRHQTSISAGTIFDKTRTSLTTWFEAAWHVTTAKSGMSAKTLERTLGTSYRVAWTMLQRFRVAMVDDKWCLLMGGGSYNGLPGKGYTRKIIVLSSSGDPTHVSMTGVHQVSSLLKRWILGTHQGSVVLDNLQSYLEEFTFRFNRRTSRSRGLVFRRLLEQAVVTGPITEDDVTYGYNWGCN